MLGMNWDIETPRLVLREFVETDAPMVLNLLNDLKRTLGFTAIFISHDLSVVHHISDRIIVMHEGHIIESGTADEIFHHPKEPYTRALVASIPGTRKR